jgi:hypothetical protein
MMKNILLTVLLALVVISTASAKTLVNVDRKKLEHDFVALALVTASLDRSGDRVYRAQLSLPATTAAPIASIAAWVRPANSPVPIQAAGGWVK